MSRYYKQMQRRSEAKHLLQERLAREEMGTEAYDEMVSNHNDRTFKIFGVVFIAFFAVAVLVVAWLGY